MTVYTYNNILPAVPLEEFDADVNASSITTGLPYLGCQWNQGCNEEPDEKPPCTPYCVGVQPCNGRFEVVFTSDLSSADKTTLDGIVANY